MRGKKAAFLQDQSIIRSLHNSIQVRSLSLKLLSKGEITRAAAA